MSVLLALAGRRRLALLALGLVVAAVVVGAWAISREDSAAVATCDRQRADSQERSREDTGSGEPVVVIGDSWTVGFGPEEPDELWPARLPGRVHVEGWSGSGFSAGASPCPQAQYAARAPAAVADRAALVVVQGGINDHDQPTGDIERGAGRLLESLSDHRVVVVGPPRVPALTGAMPRIDAVLERAAARHGATYVSTLDWRLAYVGDGIHLTPAGHREFGERVARVVEEEAPSSLSGE
jgi:acyl-CoA thioesterase-1